MCDEKADYFRMLNTKLLLVIMKFLSFLGCVYTTHKEYECLEYLIYLKENYFAALERSIGWSFSEWIKKDREFSSFIKKKVLSTKVILKKAVFSLMLLKALIQMLITGFEKSLKHDYSAYSTMYPSFVLLLKISILIAYSAKGAQANNCKKQQKSYLVLVYLAVIYM